MIRVIIADDEERICKLIVLLVDWEELGMKVVYTARNGVEAIEAIRKYKPDIIITDMKMPGCDGLSVIEEAMQIKNDIHYIVISGYKQFEYARKAIAYGVSNYILKPIDKEELVQTLKRVREEISRSENEKVSGYKLQELEKISILQKRKLLIEMMAGYRVSDKKKITLEEMNEEYHYEFQENVFQVIAMKIDGLHQQSAETSEYLATKIQNELKRSLSACIDWEFIQKQELYLLIVNYDGQTVQMEDTMNRFLSEILIQENVFENFQMTVGLGEVEDYNNFIYNGFKAAKWAIDQRLLEGTNKVLQGKRIHANTLLDIDIVRDFNKTFSEAIECQDKKKIIESIDLLENQLLARKETTGYEIYQMCKEALNNYVFILRNLAMPIRDADDIFRIFSVEIHNCGKAQETFAYLKKTIEDSFEKVLEEKETMDSKPIREAKTYILKHLCEPISLEGVSDYVGFNSAYFSTVFKKETGFTFSEFLFDKRMERAKMMLRESKESVADICNAIGYSDVKHFTKNFTKHTGVKPKEYKKLYS